MDRAALALGILGMVFSSLSWIAHMVAFFHLGRRK